MRERLRLRADHFMSTTAAVPIIALAPTWENVESTLRDSTFRATALAAYIRERRWFGGKAHVIRDITLVEWLALREAGRLALVRVDYEAAPSEVYLLPLQLVAEAGDGLSVLVHFRTEAAAGALVDAVGDASFRAALLALMIEEQRVPAAAGELIGICGAALRSAAGSLSLPLPSRTLAAEQSNTSILYDTRYFLKLYRKPEAGENPDAELLRFLSERQHFPHVPAFCGAIELRPRVGDPRVLGLLVANVPNRGDAWAFTLAALAEFFARVQSTAIDSAAATPAQLADLLGDFPARARLLGERTAQMHLAFSADTTSPPFAPEPFTRDELRTLADAMADGTRRMAQLLEHRLSAMPERARPWCETLLHRTADIIQRQQRLAAGQIHATRTRHHGDYHLGQVLTTDDDFVIIDFEGEPARSLPERRAKRTPLRDVAGMLRSFHYAAYSALGQLAPDTQTPATEAWAERWAREIGQAFLTSYLTTARGASFLPADEAALALLLDACLLEKAAYEVCYELNNRPDWVLIPVRGILGILDRAAA